MIRHTARNAFAVLVGTARERFAAGFASAGFDFDDLCWDIRALKDRSANSASPRLYFTRHGTTDDPLPPDFGLAVKSWLILEFGSAANMGPRLDSVRMLWEAILTRRRRAATRFRWEDLCSEDLSQAELLMRAHWSESTVYKRVINIIGFAEFLAARGITRSLYYRPQAPRIEDFNRHTIAGQQERRDRLPTEAALLGLADIYRELATEPRDRLRIAAIAILVVTGFRIGELLTMPADCEVEEVRGGKPRYGLRYFREKSRGGAKMFAVRWLTATGAELARPAIAEIRSLTDAARQRAQELERTPHRVPIPGYHWAARMSAAVRSAFERFDVREPDDSFCRVTSHQFRHWLNYVADKGGLPVDLQTRWLGRENPRDTDAYRHATVDERLAWVKDGIRNGQLSGATADAFFELPRSKRDVFLEAEIQAVHVTAFGLCLHDFAVTPCQYHLNCVRGCPDYLRTKGSCSERDHLVQIQLATERALAGAKARGDVAQAWVNHYEQTLVGIRRALAVDEDSSSADGTLVRPFAGAKRH